MKKPRPLGRGLCSDSGGFSIAGKELGDARAPLYLKTASRVEQINFRLWMLNIYQIGA